MMVLLSSMPCFRSLYSRYFPTISVISLWALAVFWYFAESLIVSGDARAWVSSSYLFSIWFKRSNIECDLLYEMHRVEAWHVGLLWNYLRNLRNHQFAAVG